MARTCGTCTLCCKLPRVAELNKPAGVWCVSCHEGQGCTIYDSRPQVCRFYMCGWLGGVGSDEMRPDKSGVILSLQHVKGFPEPYTNVVFALVDPDTPDAWQTGPMGEYLESLLLQGEPILLTIGDKQQLRTRNTEWAARLGGDE